MNGRIVFCAFVAVVRFCGAGELLVFSPRGAVESCSVAGRELVAKPVPFVTLQASDGRTVEPASLRETADGLVFDFGVNGSLTLVRAPFDGGETFTVADCTLADAATVTLGRMQPACNRWRGHSANMLSDPESGVCVRSYDLRPDMLSSKTELSVRVAAARAKGVRFGVVAAPRAGLQKALQRMTLLSGRPHSPSGGAWALGSDAARCSYLFGDPDWQTIAPWISLAERGGFGVFHFRERWYARLGHYDVNTNRWPKGLSQLKEAADKVHAAGLYAGMHTLTGCIDPEDPWVAGPDNADLLSWEEYTLAADLPADADTLVVNEPPRVLHDVVFTYSGNGNAIRIGNEIVQYTGFTKEPPYSYTGLVRGAFGTRPAAHAKGDRAAYLRQRYKAFYPDVDKPLSDKLADAIGRVFLGCGFDQIYQDGAEGFFDDYATGSMRNKIAARLVRSGRPVIVEDSNHCDPRGWWFHSRVGAWDSATCGPKRFQDWHIAELKEINSRQADLLEMQMGWWAPDIDWDGNPTHMIDDVEYFASSTAGLDAPMSMGSIEIRNGVHQYHQVRQITVAGWYERFRRARAFADGLTARFATPRAEFRLRQNAATGVWEVAPATWLKGRMRSDDERTGTFELASAPTKGVLRVEALYAPTNTAARRPFDLTAGRKAADFTLATHVPDLSFALADGTDGKGKSTFRLTATNRDGRMPTDTAAQATMKYDPYVPFSSDSLIRFRVKGDGSGALFVVQPETPREFGRRQSEHCVKLDFTGWRTFEMSFREKDVETFDDYTWPKRGYHQRTGCFRGEKKLSALNFWMNGLPAGREVCVEVSDVTLVPQGRHAVSEMRVVLNGQSLAVPFELASGEFAELEDGVWTRYDAWGLPLARRVTGEVPRFVAGKNIYALAGRTADGFFPRLQCAFGAIGPAEPALKPRAAWTDETKRLMAYEAQDLQWYEPAKGFDALAPIVVRPDEAASVEFTVSGRLPAFSLTIGDRTESYPAVNGTPVKFAFPGRMKGVLPVSVTCADGATAARFEFVKRYR